MIKVPIIIIIIIGYSSLKEAFINTLNALGRSKRSHFKQNVKPEGGMQAMKHCLLDACLRICITIAHMSS